MCTACYREGTPEWVVCEKYHDRAWVSHSTGHYGTYKAREICQQLGMCRNTGYTVHTHTSVHIHHTHHTHYTHYTHHTQSQITQLVMIYYIRVLKHAKKHISTLMLSSSYVGVDLTFYDVVNTMF